METTIHRQLKALYAGDPDCREVRVNGFRIDAIAEGRLVEIQSAPLSAIRRKVAALLERHRVLVVKPLAERTFIVRRGRRGGPVESQRYSPARETLFHLFVELVHFVDVFPHPRLDLDVLLVEQEEHRRPQVRRRWRSKEYRVDDRLLRRVNSRVRLRTAEDLGALLPAGLPAPFTTAEISRAAAVPRWLAQKIAYCLRKTGAIAPIGKRRNTILYRAANGLRVCERKGTGTLAEPVFAGIERTRREPVPFLSQTLSGAASLSPLEPCREQAFHGCMPTSRHS
ncbi:MAG TPA: hypothetical protein VML55_04685 [Planctomycetaceae bacterium]|nr:hypothetical protein [Planctomycetaceae bacterium]